MQGKLEDALDVSRETRELLGAFSEDLLKWTKRINLIAPSTQSEIWDRHILDSAQLWLLREGHHKIWCDIGSGGGLPGLVLAILSKGEEAPVQFFLIESDVRKCAFLTTTIAKYDLPATVIPKRIEAADPVGANVVSARALAPLPELIELAMRHGKQDAVLLLQKGAQYKNEIDAARESWHFNCEIVPSRTHPDAVVLKINEVTRA